MKLTCSKCHEAPRASLKSHRCAACERLYRNENIETRRASASAYYKRNAKKLAEQRESTIQWWTRQTKDAIALLRAEYERRDRDLPREYFTAMRRIERERRTAQLGHLSTLPKRLQRAAIAWFNACQSGSRPSDYERARHAKTRAEEAQLNAMYDSVDP